MKEIISKIKDIHRKINELKSSIVSKPVYHSPHFMTKFNVDDSIDILSNMLEELKIDQPEYLEDLFRSMRSKNEFIKNDIIEKQERISEYKKELVSLIKELSKEKDALVNANLNIDFLYYASIRKKNFLFNTDIDAFKELLEKENIKYIESNSRICFQFFEVPELGVKADVQDLLSKQIGYSKSIRFTSYKLKDCCQKSPIDLNKDELLALL